MAKLLTPVLPGDLITSTMWNDAVEAINELLKANQNNGIAIAAMSPEGTMNDPFLIDKVVQITGQNFGYSVGQTSVTFKWGSLESVVPYRELLVGSSDSRLLFRAPTFSNPPQTGAFMTMIVDNGMAQDARTVFVKPVVITLIGDIFLTWRADVAENPVPNPLKASTTQETQSATFALQLQSAINILATVSLSADIPSADTDIPAGLVDSIEFHDENDKLISGNSFEMGKNDTRNILVYIPQVPVSFADKSFTLQVNAIAGSKSGFFAREFTVGKEVTSDQNIKPTLTSWDVFDASYQQVIDTSRGTLDGSTIKLQPGLEMDVTYNLTLEGSQKYDLTVEPKDGTTLSGWSLQPVAPLSQITAPVTGKQVYFSVKPSAGDSPTGTIVFRIKQHEGATTDWSQEFGLQLL